MDNHGMRIAHRILVVMLILLAGVATLAVAASFIWPGADTGISINSSTTGRTLWYRLNDGSLTLRTGRDVPARRPPAPAIRSALGLRHEVAEFGGGRRNYRVHTVGIPLWMPLVLFAAYPVAILWRGPIRRRLRGQQGQCPVCGYDLRGNKSGVCPECGHTRSVITSN